MAKAIKSVENGALQRGAFTDSPNLHSNPVLGSLQLLLWIFFHPSAWLSYLSRLGLPADSSFFWLRLRNNQWKSRSQLKLLFLTSFILPVLASLPSVVVTAMSGTPGIYIFGTWLYVVTIAFTLTAWISLLIDVWIGFTAGFLLAFWVGLLASLSEGNLETALIATAICLVFGIVVSIAINGLGYSTQYSPRIRRTIGVIVGVVIGALSVGVIQRLILIGLASNLSANISSMIANSIAIGLGFGLVAGFRRNLLVGFAIGLVASGIYALSHIIWHDQIAGFIEPVTGGVIFTARIIAAFLLAYVLAERLAGSLAGVIAGALAVSGRELYIGLAENNLLIILPLGICALIVGFTFHRWLNYVFGFFLEIYNFSLLRLDQFHSSSHSSLLRYHAAFWYEHRRSPWGGLDEHLLLLLDRNSAEGRQAMDYIANSRYQRWAAQSVQIELDARLLEASGKVSEIGSAHYKIAVGELAGPASALLRSFSRISQDVDAALRQESAYNQRLALSAVEDRLDSLLRELARSSEPYTLRFRPIADHWRQVLAVEVKALAATVEARQEIDSPYIIGVPLTAQQEIFIGRSDISARIEQLLLDRRRPPLLLYGQRRMGKTSLLNNLGRLLPSTIVPLFVDLQGPVSRSSDQAGMLYYMARSMGESAAQHRQLKLPAVTREQLDRDPFGVFDEWLADVEYSLSDATGLLMLDEFEALDQAITRGRFDEEGVLGMLRHIIQHRPRFKLLLAGSHTLDEFRRWSSYLINAQVVQISYLQEAEARQLIERPAKDFALRYEPASSNRILELTRGHPFLVQLLCAEVVALKNGQDPGLRRLARLEDVETAIPDALASGDMFFADIANNQINSVGSTLLRAIARRGEGVIMSERELEIEVPEQLPATLHLLLQRDLIERAKSGYRFQVELIRRWFAEN